jgi:hypothetical protein
MGLTNVRTLTNELVEDGANTYTATVNYAQGPQPLNSVGANFDSPLAAGQSSSSITINGQRKLFYNTGLQIQGSSSSQIRAFNNSLLNPQNGTTFTVTMTAGEDRIIFAYPATLRDVTVARRANELQESFLSVLQKTLVTVEGANGYNPVQYKVYTYTEFEPLDENTIDLIMEVTI